MKGLQQRHAGGQQGRQLAREQGEIPGRYLAFEARKCAALAQLARDNAKLMQLSLGLGTAGCQQYSATPLALAILALPVPAPLAWVLGGRSACAARGLA